MLTNTLNAAEHAIISADAITAVGIDIGSTNTKVSVIHVDNALGVREIAVSTAVTPDDATALKRTVARLVAQVLGTASVIPRVVGIASMAETGVPLDDDGEPLTGLIRWNGSRDRAAADRLVAGLGRNTLFTTTGVQPGPKAPLAIWAWLKEERPELWRAMARWAGASELIGLALTGKFSTDHTLAGRTMAYRLPAPGGVLPTEFDPDLLNAVGLRPAQLPRVIAPGEIAGRITREAGANTGLAVGTPVVIAGHDHAVGSWAAGVRRPGEVADSVGTAEALVRVLADAVDSKMVAASGMSLTRTITGEHESLIAGSASAGSLVRWWFETHLGEMNPMRALASVGSFDPEPSGLLVLPYLIGRQTPSPDPDARIRVLDRSGAPVDPGNFGRARLAKAPFEGLAMQLRWMDDEQRRIVGMSSCGEAMVVFGPGTNDPDLMAVKAAVLDVPLCTVVAREPVASGAALLAAVRAELGDSTLTLPTHSLDAATQRSGYDELFRNFISAAKEQSSPAGSALPERRGK